MTQDFIFHYIKSQQGTVVPIEFTRACAVYLLMLAIERRVWLSYEHFQVTPPIYMVLVGSPASKKGTAMSAAKRMFKSVFPDYPINANVASRESIIKRMAASHRPFVNGEQYSPMASFVTELENFLSFDPRAMIQFLTDVYDEPFFDSSTVKRGLENLVNPMLNLIACTVPTYVSQLLRENVMKGGILRRMLFHVCSEDPARVTFPAMTEESKVAAEWCKAHLARLGNLTGPFAWDDEARAYFAEWDKGNGGHKESVWCGYFASKDIIASKIAMLMALAEPEPKLIITLPAVEKAIAFLEANEEGLFDLEAASGHNANLQVRFKLLDAIKTAGGWMPEKRLHRQAAMDLDEKGYSDLLSMLKATDQVIVAPVTIRGQLQNMVMLPDKWNMVRAEQEANLARVQAEATTEEKRLIVGVRPL